MAQSIWTETTCDRCGLVDRQEIAITARDLPQWWVDMETSRHISLLTNSPGFQDGPAHILTKRRILCDPCWTSFQAWMKPTKYVEVQK